MFLLKSIIFAVIAIVSIEANLIYKVKVNTASCDDCGMSNTFGALRLQVSKLVSLKFESYIIALTVKKILILMVAHLYY